MREDHRPYQLLRNKFLVPVGIKVALVDFTGNLVRLHSMAGTGEGGGKTMDSASLIVNFLLSLLFSAKGKTVFRFYLSPSY